MTQDLDPWRLFASSPQEQSAFRLLSAQLAAQGQHVALRGKPDDEPTWYQRLFEVAAGVLTVDAHLAVDGTDWYVDHTTVPLPGSAWLPSAMRAASETLNHLFASVALLSPTGSPSCSPAPRTRRPRRPCCPSSTPSWRPALRWCSSRDAPGAARSSVCARSRVASGSAGAVKKRHVPRTALAAAIAAR